MQPPETSAHKYLNGLWTDVYQADVVFGPNFWLGSAMEIIQTWPGIVRRTMRRSDARHLAFEISTRLAQSHYYQFHQEAFAEIERRRLYLDLGHSLLRTITLAKASKAFDSAEIEEERMPSEILELLDSISFEGLEGVEGRRPFLSVSPEYHHFPSAVQDGRYPPSSTPPSRTGHKRQKRSSGQPKAGQGSGSSVLEDDIRKLKQSAPRPSEEKDVFGS